MGVVWATGHLLVATVTAANSAGLVYTNSFKLFEYIYIYIYIYIST